MTDRRPLPSFFKSYSELTNVVSVVVYCSEDSSFLFTSENDSAELWIPSEKSSINNEEWRSVVEKMMKDLFQAEVKSGFLIKVYKIWQPDNRQPLIHAIFAVLFTLDQKRKRNIIASPKVKLKARWVLENELLRLMGKETFRSPEVLDFIAIIRGRELDDHSRKMSNRATILGLSPWTDLVNYSPQHVLYEVTEKHVLVAVDKDTPVGDLSAFEQLVQAAQLFRQDQLNLYKEFLTRSFPCMFLSKESCADLFSRIGWPKESLPGIFRACDNCNRGALSYRDVLFGVAAMEPDTVHGGLPAELRCRCIFRFFDANSDGRMEYVEFRELVTALRKSKNQSLDQASIDTETVAAAKTIGLQPDAKLNLQDFLRAVGELKIRGTSQILRSPNSMRKYLTDQYSLQLKAGAKAGDVKVAPPKPTAVPAQPGVVSGAQPQYDTKKMAIKYSLAVHCIKLKKSGTIIDSDQLWNMEAAVSKSTDFGPRSLAIKRQSTEAFNLKSLPNEVLNGIRYFEQTISQAEAAKKASRNPKAGYSWGNVDLAAFAKHLINICEKLRDICKAEPRLLEISSPVLALGDIHGNLSDLLYFDKVLWRLGPGLSPASLLFLGDYVDRGPHGVEVIAYLFAQKVASPKKIWLIRGNHEVRNVQKLFTFYSECLMKFGEAVGHSVWESVNTVFDVLPLAAVIDNEVFCCHGGIPPPWLCPKLTTINSIPTPLHSPDQQSALAWDLIWNDPTRQAKPSDSLAYELIANDGFAFNSRRGTAHIFSTEALERFLLVNNLSYVVRAHEVAMTGFQIQQKGKLLTVFSSSRYCGGVNEAACVLVDQKKLRVFRIETS